jgi:hypothetical protein
LRAVNCSIEWVVISLSVSQDSRLILAVLSKDMEAVKAALQTGANANCYHTGSSHSNTVSQWLKTFM